MAGFLADVKFGRYKTLQYITWIILAVSSLAVFASLIVNNNIGDVPAVSMLLAEH